MIPFPLDAEHLDALVRDALAEDVGSGDITSESCIDTQARLTARMNAREDMVLAGLPFAHAVFHAVSRAQDAYLTAEMLAADGDYLGTGSAIMRVSGSARAVLTAERTALNMVQALSGIATMTRRYVKALDSQTCTLLDTRKTLPGYRRLAKYAAALGGARNHRMGLYDAIMIKDNHIAAAGGIVAAVQAAKAASDLDVQVECDTLVQVEDALAAGADSLLLDNMAPDILRRAVSIVGGRIPLEASGGVTLETIHAIGQTGVDFVSVGRLTQSAPAVDIGLDFDQPQ